MWTVILALFSWLIPVGGYTFCCYIAKVGTYVVNYELNGEKVTIVKQSYHFLAGYFVPVVFFTFLSASIMIKGLRPLFPKTSILWHEPLCLTSEWQVWHGKITELYFPVLGPGYSINWKRRTMTGNGFTVYLPNEISSNHLRLLSLPGLVS